MAFIDLVRWEKMDPSIFAWRFPETNLSSGTQLIVHESQEAVLLSQGSIVGVFPAGKHTLSSENLPMIRTLYGIPFGKNNPFTVEVWFVNRRAPLNIDWKCSNMMISDPQFRYVPIVANGQYGLRIEQAERFISELVGNATEYRIGQITDHFSGLIEQYTKNAIVNFITSNQVPVTQINASLTEISEAVRKQMVPFWHQYGLTLAAFFITDIGIDRSDPVGEKILDAIASSSAQSIAGYTWQQAQAMEVAKGAVSGPGGDMGILGMAMLTGAFGGSFGSQMMQPPQPAQGGVPQAGHPSSPHSRRKTVYCSSCGRSYPSTSRFCPHCGDPYNPCPVCGADNSADARRCVSCGAQLISMNDVTSEAGYSCPSCGAAVSPGTKFCPNCGQKLS